LVLATGGALGIVWALIRADSRGWGSHEIIGTLTAGVVLAAAFVAWELRTDAPMVPVRLFRSRPVAAGNAATFTIFALLMAMVFFMAQFLETGLGYGPLGAGVRLVAGGLAVAAAAMTWIGLIARPGLPYWQLVAPLLLAGCGVSVAIPATMSAVMTAAPPAAIGQASGTLNMLRQLGGVFGVAICA